MKAYKITRRREPSPVVRTIVKDVDLPKPNIPCIFIRKIHKPQLTAAAVGRLPVVQEGHPLAVEPAVELEPVAVAVQIVVE